MQHILNTVAHVYPSVGRVLVCIGLAPYTPRDFFNGNHYVIVQTNREIVYNQVVTHSDEEIYAAYKAMMELKDSRIHGRLTAEKADELIECLSNITDWYTERGIVSPRPSRNNKNEPDYFERVAHGNQT